MVAGDRFVPFSELKELGIPYSPLTIRRMIKKGRFPAPREVSPNRKAWRLSEIEKWMAARPIWKGQQPDNLKGSAPNRGKPVKTKQPKAATQ